MTHGFGIFLCRREQTFKLIYSGDISNLNPETIWSSKLSEDIIEYEEGIGTGNHIMAMCHGWRLRTSRASRLSFIWKGCETRATFVTSEGSSKIGHEDIELMPWVGYCQLPGIDVVCYLWLYSCTISRSRSTFASRVATNLDRDHDANWNSGINIPLIKAQLLLLVVLGLRTSQVSFQEGIVKLECAYY